MASFLATSLDFALATSKPPTVILPESGVNNRPIMVNTVDFPAPLGPTREVIPPEGISRSMGPMVVYFSGDRKSTRLNSSHVSISYAVFCLKKKKRNKSENERYYRRRAVQRAA